MGEDEGQVDVDGVGKAYGDKPVLADVSLNMRPGEILVVLGPSGAGKSTLLGIISGFLIPDSGRVLFGGRDVTSEPPERRNIGAVFQSYALFPSMTVAANVGFGLKRRGVSRSEARHRVHELLDLVGLSDKGDRRPQELSGGERQRVAVARALATKPALLALDEPFGNIDVQLRSSLRELLRDLVVDSNVPAMLITHDQDDAFDLADKVAVMYDGSIVQFGTVADIYERPKNAWVASFFGDANLFDLPGGAQGCRVMVRPEHVRLVGTGSGTFLGRVVDIRPTKSSGLFRYHLDVGGQRVHALRAAHEASIEIGVQVGLDWLPGAAVELGDGVSNG